jgi:hypothetical protein
MQGFFLLTAPKPFGARFARFALPDRGAISRALKIPPRNLSKAG